MTPCPGADPRSAAGRTRRRVNVTPLAVHSPGAVRDALRSHGWEDGLARASAGGIHPLAFHLTGLDQGTLEALVRFGGGLGLEVVTGDDWAIVAGSRSRMSAFARPWTAPEPLLEVAAPGRARDAGRSRVRRGAPPVDPFRSTGPILVGILNVTPDSFSDGGRFTGADAALAHADALLRDGATVIDVGGESTRPGRTELVSTEEELRRVRARGRGAGAGAPRSPRIDRYREGGGGQARRSSEGAAIVNDVTAFRFDPAMAGVVAAAGAGAILMHSRGGLLEIASYQHADYGGDVVGGVLAELRETLSAADRRRESRRTRSCSTPGFGFSKTVEQSVALFDQLAALQALGRPLLVGPSRKRFLGAITGLPVEDRDRATAAACALAWERGARLFRVHAVAAAREALAVAQALERLRRA